MTVPSEQLDLFFGKPVPSMQPRTPEQEAVIDSLLGYLREAEDARRGGENPRDDVWDENIRRYWQRYDFGDKAQWQSREVPPEFSSFIDRFAAAMKEAWVAAGVAGTYTVEDPADTERDLTDAIKRMTDVWLSTAGTGPQSQPLPFEVLIEDQMKMGALMACATLTRWDDSRGQGRVAVDTVDPRRVWLDGTGRGLYRIRRIELDRHQLQQMAKEKKGKNGAPIYNLDEIERLSISWLQEERQRESDLTGYGAEQTSYRQPLILHEFYGDIIGPMGEVLAPDALVVLGDERAVLRGPEPNPFWHGEDWVVYSPLIPMPLSVYGRTYAEDFGSLTDTFTKMTNLLLDAASVSSMKVFAMIPDMLVNPGQATTGVWPGKTFLIENEAGRPVTDFMHAVEMGSLSPDTVRVWQMLKSEITEAAGINEIGLGQFAPKGRTSATEIAETQQSSSALIRSVAQSAELRVISPTINRVWKTGVQHVKKGDKQLAAAAGPELFAALMGQRKKLVSRPITFQARGISNLLQKNQKLRNLMQVLQIIFGNPVMAQEFMAVADMGKVVDLILDLSNIDPSKLTLSPREQMIRAITAQAPAPGGTPQGQTGAAGVAQALGVQR